MVITIIFIITKIRTNIVKIMVEKGEKSLIIKNQKSQKTKYPFNELKPHDDPSSPHDRFTIDYTGKKSLTSMQSQCYAKSKRSGKLFKCGLVIVENIEKIAVWREPDPIIDPIIAVPSPKSSPVAAKSSPVAPPSPMFFTKSSEQEEADKKYHANQLIENQRLLDNAIAAGPAQEEPKCSNCGHYAEQHPYKGWGKNCEVHQP
jgi:hypothetical protein